MYIEKLVCFLTFAYNLFNLTNRVLQRNNVKVFGNGSQPMLFAHGFGCDQNMWRFIIPEYIDRYMIIAFDYVGCGKSDIESYSAEKYSDLNGYAQDVLDICKALNLQDIIFVGHSVSCMIGLLAAIKEPQLFSKLVFVGPSPCYINDDGYTGGFERKDIDGLLDTMERNYVGWANFLAPLVIPGADNQHLTKELEDSFCSIDPLIARNFAEVTFFSDNRNDLSKLKIPVLIIQCSDDLIAPLEVGNYIHRHLPESTLTVLETTGHCPHMSVPEETILIINEYLN